MQSGFSQDIDGRAWRNRTADEIVFASNIPMLNCGNGSAGLRIGEQEFGANRAPCAPLVSDLRTQRSDDDLRFTLLVCEGGP